MPYFEEAPKPKILLVNFTDEQASEFRQTGYNVDQSFIGNLRLASSEPLRYRAQYYHMPHPPYEYDIFIVQTDMPKEGEKYEVTGEKEFQCTADLASMAKRLRMRDSASICFLGGEYSLGNLLIAGLPQIQLQSADGRDSSLEMVDPQTFAVKEIHELLEGYRTKVKKVHKYVVSDSNRIDALDLYRLRVYVNNAFKVVCEYESYYYGGEIGCLPKYILLPEFQDNVKISLGILSKLAEVFPDLFSKSGVESWINLPDFSFEEVRKIEEDVREKKEELDLFIQKKEKEIVEINERLSFIKQILISDDEHFEGDAKLTNAVAKSLSYLGFEVELREEIIMEGKKREDIYISDTDGYKSFCEVKGTTRQNPSEGYYSQLLKHLRKANDPELNGLLIVNYDYKTHPYKRIKIYKDSEDLFSDDAEGIGVVSTVDLYRIIIAVKEGKMSKEDARKLLKASNRIEFPKEKRKESF